MIILKYASTLRGYLFVKQHVLHLQFQLHNRMEKYEVDYDYSKFDRRFKKRFF